MSNPDEYLVKGEFDLGFTARSGQYVTIVDLEGAQVGDFVALHQADPREGLSPIRTRRRLGSLFFGVRDTLSK